MYDKYGCFDSKVFVTFFFVDLQDVDARNVLGGYRPTSSDASEHSSRTDLTKDCKWGRSLLPCESTSSFVAKITFGMSAMNGFSSASNPGIPERHGRFVAWFFKTSVAYISRQRVWITVIREVSLEMFWCCFVVCGLRGGGGGIIVVIVMSPGTTAFALALAFPLELSFVISVTVSILLLPSFIFSSPTFVVTLTCLTIISPILETS